MGDLWKIDYGGEPLAVFYPGQGASLATVTVERVLAAGIEAMVACGGAGAVVPGLALGHVIVVDAAVRDEGTSYHYIPPSREVSTPRKVVDVLQEVVQDSGLAYTVGKTWTTDGFFRETPGRIQRRRDEGCIVVEAETAALLAVGQFRDVPIGQYLFAGDDVSGEVREDRGWRTAHDVHVALFNLAARSALRLAKS
ncbi:MAG: nucleoside phosphorylase [Acidimicrobiia bacterium]|nr:nucleoside phosphorylase [Acidimicrobiia bacterium]